MPPSVTDSMSQLASLTAIALKFILPLGGNDGKSGLKGKGTSFVGVSSKRVLTLILLE